jgi:hypothetical protein
MSYAVQCGISARISRAFPAAHLRELAGSNAGLMHRGRLIRCGAAGAVNGICARISGAFPAAHLRELAGTNAGLMHRGRRIWRRKTA